MTTPKKAGFDIKLDLRGKRAEEVIPILDRWLDEAILLEEKDLTILHGKGNGVLRQITRDFLRDSKDVKFMKMNMPIEVGQVLHL